MGLMIRFRWVMQAGMLLSLLAVVAPVMAIDGAQRAECLLVASRQADDYLVEIQQISQSFEQQFGELKAAYVASYPQDAGAADRFADFSRLRLVAVGYEDSKTDYLDAFNQTIAMLKGTVDQKVLDLCNEKQLKENALMRIIEFKDASDEAITEIKHRIELEHLDPDEGLALISIYATSLGGTMELAGDGLFGGSESFTVNGRSQFVKLVKLKQGSHLWTKVRIIWERYYDFTELNRRFTVTAGKLNLAGVYIFSNFGARADTELSDRTAILLKILQSEYPYLAKAYEVVNGLVPDDPFVSFYLQQQQHHLHQQQQQQQETTRTGI